MEEVFKKKIQKVLKKNFLELILFSLALVLTIISLFFYFKNIISQEPEMVVKENTEYEAPKRFVYIDVSGAVKKPDVYKLTFGSRLKEAINLAGGLTEEADSLFFSRNFNLARIINDQEKIYIPTKDEVNQGLVESQPIQFENLVQENNQSQQEEDLISINLATQSQLEELPGVGKVTAQKIIDNRPYQSIDELLSKKIVNKSTYEKIKDLVSL